MTHPTPAPPLHWLATLLIVTLTATVACAQEATDTPPLGLSIPFESESAQDTERLLEPAIPDGAVKYVEGHAGQAASFDGSTVVMYPETPWAEPGDRSWTLEAWVKTDAKPQRHADLLASYGAHGRVVVLRLDPDGRLVGIFGADDQTTAVAAGPADAVYDGKWHRVAAVRDMSRGGEVRLYIDGQRMDQEAASMPWPIQTEDARMPLHIGRGLNGLLDDVRIATGVHPDYALLPQPADAPQRPQARAAALPSHVPESTAPLALDPATTRIVIPAFMPFRSDFRTAEWLQAQLRRAYKIDSGFEIVRDAQVDEADNTPLLALGRSKWLLDSELNALAPDEVLVRRKINVVVIAGGLPRTTRFAAARFLDEFAGIRFYMPGDLFTSRPQPLPITLTEVDLKQEPYVRAGAAYMWGVPGGEDFMLTHALYRRPSSHQHTMYERLRPEWFDQKYPQIYPVIQGKRHLPTPGDQNWQPSFSEPTLVDAAVASARRFFAENPNDPYVAFSIQDSHVYDDRDLASEAVRTLGEERGLSTLYWRFLDQVARRLEKELPGKFIMGLAYGKVAHPPQEKLHPNVLPCLVFKMSDLPADQRFQERAGGNLEAGWAAAAKVLGHHDWANGQGFLIPRIYTNHVKSTFMGFDRLGAPLRFAYAEPYPHWGMDGPKYYLMARLWWDPTLDPDAELRQMCDDLFGKGATPMYQYFKQLEALFDAMNRDQERKLFRWQTQFQQTPQQRAMTRQCRELLDQAAAAEADPEVQQRIDLFSRTFRYSEMLLELANDRRNDEALRQQLRQHVAEKIAPDPMTVYRAKEPSEVTTELEAVLKALAPSN